VIARGPQTVEVRAVEDTDVVRLDLPLVTALVTS
jgi:hypothetical protein